MCRTAQADARRRPTWIKGETMPNVLSDHEKSLLDAYWRAANYLSVGQIYLYDNPLLQRTLTQGAYQAASAGPLGNDSRPELHLCPFQSRDQEETT